MSKTNSPLTNSQLNTSYELKHRLVGAAIIILSAVLVIPLLLENPRIKANVNTGFDQVGEQKTFKSKIKPVSLRPVNAEQGLTLEGGQNDKVSKPALVDSRQKKIVKQKVKEIEEKEKIVLTVSNSSSTGSSQPVEKVRENEASAEKKTQIAVNDAESKARKSIKDGWAVRVGTFSKNENVISVSTLLKSNGFDVNYTKVNTTLGGATRVWLGPYADKRTAEKVSMRLKKITGEKGYVAERASGS